MNHYTTSLNPYKTFNKILSNYISEKGIAELPKRWEEPHRAYHNTNHLVTVMQNIESDIFFDTLNTYEKHALLLAAFFHDVIHDYRLPDNEDKSIEYFKHVFKNNDPRMINTVSSLIECTKHRKRPIEKLHQIFWDADNKEMTEGYTTLLENEVLIRKEISHLSNKEYKEERVQFLETCLGTFDTNTDKDINKLIEYVKKMY